MPDCINLIELRLCSQTTKLAELALLDIETRFFRLVDYSYQSHQVSSQNTKMPSSATPRYELRLELASVRGIQQARISWKSVQLALAKAERKIAEAVPVGTPI